MKDLNIDDYKTFINEIIFTINSARYNAFKSINKHHIGLNFEIGKQIVINQSKHGWGKSIVNSMSTDINKLVDYRHTKQKSYKIINVD